MQQSEIDEVSRYIDQLISVTSSGPIQWAAANPTTYIWLSPPPHAGRIILQHTKGLERTKTSSGSLGLAAFDRYQLQATDAAGGVKFSASGAEAEAINKKLAVLFSEIEKTISRKGLDFLKSLIPGS